ncbi:BAG domain-containing protein [Entamoeba marina]
MSSEKSHDPNTFSAIRNFQTQQQGILLGLLSLHYDICIEAPKKKSVVTQPFLKVIKLCNDKECIPVGEIVSSIVEKLHEEDISKGVSSKTAMRRYEVNRISEQLLLLASLLKKVGSEIKAKNIGKKRLREKICSIHYESLIFDLNDIQRKGSQINAFFLDCLHNTRSATTVFVSKQDTEMMSILADF